MKRARKCCCCDGDLEVIAESEPTGGNAQWDLTQYQKMKFPRFRDKYWRIILDDQAETVKARGKIDSKGRLSDLPTSFDLSSGIKHKLIAACSPTCGDPDFVGKVVATNEGIAGRWDLTSYQKKRYPTFMNGYAWIREIYNCSPSWGVEYKNVKDEDLTQYYHELRLDDEGKIIDLPDYFETSSGTNHYAELVVSCLPMEWDCIESPVDNNPTILFSGTFEELKELIGMPGIGQPGYRWVASVPEVNHNCNGCQPPVLTGITYSGEGYIDTLGTLHGLGFEPPQEGECYDYNHAVHITAGRTGKDRRLISNSLCEIDTPYHFCLTLPEEPLCDCGVSGTWTLLSAINASIISQEWEWFDDYGVYTGWHLKSLAVDLSNVFAAIRSLPTGNHWYFGGDNKKHFEFQWTGIPNVWYETNFFQSANSRGLCLGGVRGVGSLPNLGVPAWIVVTNTNEGEVFPFSPGPDMPQITAFRFNLTVCKSD